MKYRMILGSHGRFEAGAQVIYRAGVEGRDILDLTPAEAVSLGDRVVPLEPAVADEGATADAGEGQEKKGTRGKRGGSR